MLKQIFTVLILLISLVFCKNLLSLNLDINAKRFKRIASNDGLSNNEAFCVFQDSRGYFWIGTQNGLNRFDGYNFRIFQTDEGNTNSLSNSWVYDIKEDKQGLIWIATMQGLNIYDYSVNKFYQFKQGSRGNRIQSGTFRSLMVDGDHLWVGGKSGLYLINTHSHEVSEIISGYAIYDMVMEGDHTLWLGTDQKLLQYKLKNKMLSVIDLPEESSISSLSIYQDRLILGTYSGVVYFDLQNKIFIHSENLLQGIAISDLLLEQDEDRLWVATFDEGLYQYSLKNNHSIKVGTKDHDEFFFSSSNLRGLDLDTNGRLWVSSGEGVHYADINSSVHMLRSSNAGLGSDFVTSIAMKEPNIFWIGTSKGVSKYDGRTSESYGVGKIHAVKVIDSNVLAVGNNGVFTYEPLINQMVNLNDRIPEFKQFDYQLVFDIVKISAERFLLATYEGIVDWRKDKATSKLLKIKGVHSKANNSFMALYQFNGIVLLSNFKGFYFFDKDTEEIERYLSAPDLTPLDNTYVAYTISDTNGNIWAGTGKGLFKLRNREIVAQYTTEHGLLDNGLRAMTIVDERLWISTDYGLNVFDVRNNGFKKIHLNDDQFDFEFDGKSVFKDQNDIVYFGGVEGLIYFDPKEFLLSEKLPRPRITGFYLFNRLVTPGTEFLPRAAEDSSNIELRHDQNMITFEFSSLNLSQPKHIYAFQMQDGTDESDQWIYVSEKNRRATFTPSPGEYTFRLKSGWDEKHLSDEMTKLSVTILPPWWQTNFAYTIYIGLLLFSIVAIIKIRTDRLQKYAAQLKREVADQTEEIQGLLEKKNELFANVSHELRTPLTLIIDPIKDLIEKCSEPEQKESLLLVKRNSQRLLHMVDQLLNIAKANQDQKQEPQIHNFSYMVHLLINSTKRLLNNKNINLSVSCEDGIYVEISNENLETIVLNLITNAIKYCNNDGEIKICLSKHSGYAQFSVVDTGIGIASEYQDIIFERFKRIDHQNNRDIPGTGIGLALVREVLDMHHGTITVNSDIGKGCEFTVRIPLAKSQKTAKPGELSLLARDETDYIEESLNDPSSIIDANDLDVNRVDDARILVIEDTKDMRDYLHSIISESYYCETAKDAESGLQHAKRHIPDLIVCDVMMPGMNGFELLQKIRDDEHLSHIPLILLTAKTGKENELEGLNKLADDYITKPFDRDILLTRITNLLSVRALLRDYFTQQFVRSEYPHKRYQATLVEKGQTFLQKFHQLIEENFQNANYSVDDMSLGVHMSKRTLQQKLKSVIEQSPREYLILYRLKYAAKLLMDTELTISQIQEEAGFRSASRFANSFKQHFKVSAREYRNQSNMVD